MSSINRVELLGYLGRDPEMRYLPSGKGLCTFSIATSESFEGQKGRVEKTEWHKIVVFGPTGEACGKYLRKGSRAFVEGKIQSREYNVTDQRTGQQTKRTSTEIVAFRVHFLSSPRDAGAPAEEYRGPAAEEPPPMDDSDIPFACPWDVSAERRFRV